MRSPTKVQGFKLINSMSFGESMISIGFIQKTIKVDLHVRFNAFLHRETDTRRFQRTPRRDREQGVARWGRPAPPGDHLPPRPTCQPPCCNVDSPPSPRLHQHRPLVGLIQGLMLVPQGYIIQPLPLPLGITLVIKLFEKTETLIILRTPVYSRAQLVRLGLEGGKQALLGFLIVSRA